MPSGEVKTCGAFADCALQEKGRTISTRGASLAELSPALVPPLVTPRRGQPVDRHLVIRQDSIRLLKGIGNEAPKLVTAGRRNGLGEFSPNSVGQPNETLDS